MIDLMVVVGIPVWYAGRVLEVGVHEIDRYHTHRYIDTLVTSSGETRGVVGVRAGNGRFKCLDDCVSDTIS